MALTPFWKISRDIFTPHYPSYTLARPLLHHCSANKSLETFPPVSFIFILSIFSSLSYPLLKLRLCLQYDLLNKYIQKNYPCKLRRNRRNQPQTPALKYPVSLSTASLTPSVKISKYTNRQPHHPTPSLLPHH
jgi:hypothetical protein